MKAILVIDIPDAYADRYNVENMYVWNLIVQDKHGYEMFDLTTDKPSHLKPLPNGYGIDIEEEYALGFNACLAKITGETE